MNSASKILKAVFLLGSLIAFSALTSCETISGSGVTCSMPPRLRRKDSAHPSPHAPLVQNPARPLHPGEFRNTGLVYSL